MRTVEVLRGFDLEGVRIEIVRGDITEEDVDVIVNAANSHLKHGGGVAGAIVRRGGREIQVESDEYVRRNGPVKTGNVAVTSAGKLKARWIVHAVGPVWGEGNEDEKLKDAVMNSLKKADELGARSISIPAISSGIFGFPKERCAEVFFETIKNFVASKPKNLKLIRLCNIDSETSEIFLRKSFEFFGK